MAASKIKNPIINITIVDLVGDKTNLPTIPITSGEELTSNINGSEFKFILNQAATALLIKPVGKKIAHLKLGQTLKIETDKEVFKITLHSDIVSAKENSFFDFVLHSIWMHVVLAALIGVMMVLVPAKKIETKNKASMDINKIKNILKKVELKKLEKLKPKPIVKKEPPKPKPIVKIEPPKPKVITPKPKKVVKKPPPKPKRIIQKKPIKKIVKKVIPPKGRKITRKKKPRPIKPRPIKRPKKVVKAFRKGPTKAQLAAKARATKRAAIAKRKQAKRAKLAKSLNFLSTSKGSFSLNSKNYKDDKKFDKSVNFPNASKNSKTLNRMAVASNDGPIKTTNARTIATGKVFNSGAYGKTLNNVQGQVKNSSVFGKSDLAAALTKSGALSLSGKGSIKSSIIEKILARNLDKLRFCYEKALLSDASLSGNIMMKWTIRTSGNVGGIRVVRSQLNNGSLHGCISKQLSAIRFPHPNGGSVDVKYPFSFSSTSI